MAGPVLEVSNRRRVAVEPALLKWARLTSGTTLLEASAHVRQEPSLLVEWESGRELPTLGALSELAIYYERPLETFLLPQVPIEARRPPDFRVGKTPNDGWLGRASALAIRHARRVQETVSEIRVDRQWQHPESSTSDPIAVAKVARSALRVSMTEQAGWPNPAYAFSQWRARLERTGVLVLQADMPLDEVRAFSLIGNPPVISINEHDYVASRIFSLFHEYGHIVLGAGGICTPLHRAPGRGMKAVERSMDLFAGSMLVPATELRSHSIVVTLADGLPAITPADLGRLASAFKVSTQVIWYRLRQTELITQRVFSSRWDELRHPVRRRVAARKPMIPRWQRAKRRVGDQTTRELLRAEETGQILLSEILSDLDIQTSDLDKLASAVR
jgi:Zn-dependent peptidase ImmA (M78 family)